MAIPQEHRTPRLMEIQNTIDNMSPEDVFSLPQPLPEDYQLFGAYIQLYNYVDMNLRLCVETFHTAHMLPANVNKRFRKLNDGELVDVIIPVVDTMDKDVENIVETTGRLIELQLRRTFRNLMGHFAARRYSSGDFLIMFSNNSKDYKQAHNADIPLRGMMTAALEIADLRGLYNHMATYERWIAEKALEWHRRYSVGINPNVTE
jgi:hypothetical protein